MQSMGHCSNVGVEKYSGCGTVISRSSNNGEHGRIGRCGEHERAVIWTIPTKAMRICQMSEVHADGEVHGRMRSVVVESRIYRGSNSAVCLPFAHNAAVPQAAGADHASPDLVPRLVTWADARTDLELQQT